LNDLVKEILLDSNKYYFDLSDFLSELSADSQTISVKDKNVNQHSVQQITYHLNLLLVGDNNTIGNLCFANCNEIRPEFRQTFTMIDVLDYCYAILHSETFDTFSSDGVIRIPITSDSNIFWQLVKIGFELRNKMPQI
jgi:predicted helicase